MALAGHSAGAYNSLMLALDPQWLKTAGSDVSVIRGVASNVAFQAALLNHPRFVAGQFNTGFIAEHYKGGFRAQDVPHDDPDFLLALAAVAYRRYRDRAAQITGQMPGHELRIGHDFVAILKGAAGAHEEVDVKVQHGHTNTVMLRGKTYAINTDWNFSGIRASGRCNGKPFTAQIERDGLWTRVLHNGLRADVQLLTARAAALLRLMPYKAPADMSKFLLSPMVGGCSKTAS